MQSEYQPGLGRLYFLDDVPIRHRFHRWLVIAILPHHGESPNGRIPYPKIRGCKQHLRVRWRFGSGWVILYIPTERFALPVFVSLVNLFSKRSYGIQVGNEHRDKGPKLGINGDSDFSDCAAYLPLASTQ